MVFCLKTIYRTRREATGKRMHLVKAVIGQLALPYTSIRAADSRHYSTLSIYLIFFFLQRNASNPKVFAPTVLCKWKKTTAERLNQLSRAPIDGAATHYRIPLCSSFTAKILLVDLTVEWCNVEESLKVDKRTLYVETSLSFHLFLPIGITLSTFNRIVSQADVEAVRPMVLVTRATSTYTYICRPAILPVRYFIFVTLLINTILSRQMCRHAVRRHRLWRIYPPCGDATLRQEKRFVMRTMELTHCRAQKAWIRPY